jgi:hypothetical protein
MLIATIPLSALKVPAGKVCISADIAGADLLSVICPAADIEKHVRAADEVIRTEFGPRHAHRTHVLVREWVVHHIANGTEEDRRGAMATLWWLALNHPDFSNGLRAGVSEALRVEGKAHVSITVDHRQTWAFGLADKFVSAAPIMALLPEDMPLSIEVRWNASGSVAYRLQ